MDKSENNRIVGLDLIKAIAIFYVIARHVPLTDVNLIQSLGDGWQLQLFVNLFCCGVPLFFAVDGYLLLSKKEFNLKKHIKKLINILVLYIIWSLILIIINLIFDNTQIDKFIILDLILKLNGTSLYTSELWFLEVLFAIYLIYPLLWRVFSSNENIFNYIFIIVLILTFIPSFVNIFSSFLTNEYHIFYLTKFNELFDKFNPFNYGWYLLYFMLGGLIYKKRELLTKNKIKILSVGILLLAISYLYLYVTTIKGHFIENYNDQSIFELFIITGYFALFIDINTCLFKKISIVGKYTFGIYVTHQFMIRLVRLFIPQELFVQNFLITFVTLLSSFIVSLLISKIPFINKLIKL